MITHEATNYNLLFISVMLEMLLKFHGVHEVGETRPNFRVLYPSSLQF